MVQVCRESLKGLNVVENQYIFRGNYQQNLTLDDSMPPSLVFLPPKQSFLLPVNIYKPFCKRIKRRKSCRWRHDKS